MLDLPRIFLIAAIIGPIAALPICDAAGTPTAVVLGADRTGSNPLLCLTSAGRCAATLGYWQGGTFYHQDAGSALTYSHTSGARTDLGLGTAATQNVGTTFGTVAAGNTACDITGDRDCWGAITATSAKTRDMSARLLDAVNSRDFGAVCDGSSHPISRLTSFNGVNVSGWRLGRWQAVYAFVTALDNETDQVAIVAAQKVALTKGVSLHINAGAGACEVNFTASVTPAVGQAVSVFGDGPATRISVNGSATFLAYTMPANTSGSASEMLFKDFTAYQGQAVLAGSAVSINGPTSGSGSPSPPSLTRTSGRITSLPTQAVRSPRRSPFRISNAAFSSILSSMEL